eukprot:g32020.t1
MKGGETNELIGKVKGEMPGKVKGEWSKMKDEVKGEKNTEEVKGEMTEMTGEVSGEMNELIGRVKGEMTDKVKGELSKMPAEKKGDQISGVVQDQKTEEMRQKVGGRNGEMNELTTEDPTRRDEQRRDERRAAAEPRPGDGRRERDERREELDDTRPSRPGPYDRDARPCAAARDAPGARNDGWTVRHEERTGRRYSEPWSSWQKDARQSQTEPLT